MLEVLVTAGNKARIAGRFADAERAFRQARSHLHRTVVAPTERVTLLSAEASLRRDQYRPQEALRLLGEAQRLARLAAAPAKLMAPLLAQTGSAQADVGLYREAALSHLRAKGLYRAELGDRRGDVLCLYNIADVYVQAGFVADGVRLLLLVEQAQQALTERDVRVIQWEWGRVALQLRDYELAVRTFASLTVAGSHDVVQSADGLVDLAEAYAGAGHYNRVEECARALITLLEQINAPGPMMSAAELLRHAATCRLAALVECVSTLRQVARSG